MSFELSPELDKNKVFLIKNRMLEERLDAEYYQPYHYQDLQSLEKSTFKLNKLDDVCSRIVDGPFGSAIKASDYVDDGVPFIRVADITRGEGTIKNDNLIFISEDTHKKISRSKVKPGDVIIAKTGATMGAASVVPQSIPDANIRGDLGALTVITEYCLPHYLMTYTNTPIGQRLFWRFDSGGTRGRVVIGNLKKYPILIPPKPIQAQIIAKMDNAYAVKKQKEAEAQRLLDSIDDYILGELGIELPKQEENTIESRIFTRRLSEVSGGRFDAPAYQKKYILKSKKYPMNKFIDCVSINPLTSFYKYLPETLASFIPMEKISDIYGEADISDCKMLKESGGYTKFQENDLLWAKITPCMQNGKSAVVTELKNGIGFGSTEFHVFRAKYRVNIQYVYGLLRLRSLRKHAVLFFSGSAGHQRVSDEFFKQLSIPNPPDNKQSEIANQINDIRNRAKKLQQEAKEEIERAKKEVESMILGQEESKE